MWAHSFLVVACALAMSGCGGAVATALSADGGSMQPTSQTTASETSTSLYSSVETAADSGVLANGGCAMIQASNYDQSCTVDSDCLSVWSGTSCAPGVCECPNSVIGVSARGQYLADTSAIVPDSKMLSLCNCAAVPPPCCRQGTCQYYIDCSSGADALAACTNAGGECEYAPALLLGNESYDAGPPNSCAYTDEMCVITPPTEPCPCPP